jgi:hypothetical protein
LASAQRGGPFDLSAGTLVGFTQWRLDKVETALTSAPLAISGIVLTVVRLCDRSWDVEWLSVPEDSYVAIAGVKLTGGMNFDCGKFEYGALFEDTVLGSRRLPRARISPALVMTPPRQPIGR